MGCQQLIRRTLLLLCFAWASVAAYAQPGESKTELAIKQYQAGDLMAARTTINEALQAGDAQKNPYTWYVKGFIYKEIYKEIEKGNPTSENREVAVEAILKSMALDPSGRQAENNKKALHYLAISFYNDAVLLTRSLTPENLLMPERYYLRYKALNGYLEPDKDYAKQDAEFYKNMARGCRVIYENDPVNQPVFFEKTIGYYQQAIAVQPDDFQANYNLAVNYYNRGVHKIRKIDHTTEIFELITIQDECIRLFKMALPYMLKAHEIEPQHTKTLGGLMAIYRSLSNNAEAAEYQRKLEALIQNGSTDE
jgi:hypothetical protein